MKIIIIIASVVFIIFTFYNEDNIKPNEDGHIIISFSLSESSSNDMAQYGERKSYCFSLNKNSLEIENSELEKKITIELDDTERKNLEQELLDLIKSYSLKKWNGYDEWMDVLDDFHSFTLSIEYANGKEIYAHGDHVFPNNYDDVFEAVQSVFSNYENN